MKKCVHVYLAVLLGGTLFTQNNLAVFRGKKTIWEPLLYKVAQEEAAKNQWFKLNYVNYCASENNCFHFQKWFHSVKLLSSNIAGHENSCFKSGDFIIIRFFQVRSFTSVTRIRAVICVARLWLQAWIPMIRNSWSDVVIASGLSFDWL